MKKINNKGFAISTMLFGLLIVVVLILGITISIMAFNRKNSKEFGEKLIDDLERGNSLVPSKLCKRATILHTEKCSNTDASYYCQADGYALNGTITYGNLGTKGILASGDAFDCDVNGDGVYDSSTERFYYVTDIDENSSVFIYYNNVTGGIPDNSKGYQYFGDTQYIWSIPTTAIRQLPTTEQWKNISLIKNKRDIQNEKKYDSRDLAKAFSYEGYAARLITTMELESSCNFQVGNKTTGEIVKCNYLLENTRYSNEKINIYGWWTETTVYNSTTKAWKIDGQNRSITDTDVSVADGIRPAIEVLKDNISF